MSLLFPPRCAVCESRDLRWRALFCTLCQEQLELVAHKQACFEHSPIAIKVLECSPRLASSFLVLKHNKLNLSIPDCVISNGCPLLAKKVARLLLCPYKRRPPKKAHLLLIAKEKQDIPPWVGKYFPAKVDMISFLS